MPVVISVTPMQKESVIEKEIRLAKEREEAFRREKGLVPSSNKPIKAENRKVINGHRNDTKPEVQKDEKEAQNGPRDVQQLIATSRIQMEIEETAAREKELRAAGKIITTSEETVDHKVTRMADLKEDSSRIPKSRIATRTTLSPTRPAALSPPPPKNRISPRSSSPSTPLSPTPTNFTPSPTTNFNSNRLVRSYSTTNLSTNGLTNGGSGVRSTKGLMEKFIASRGKMGPSAFGSNQPTFQPPQPRETPIITRPMKVEPKSHVVRREVEARTKVPSAPRRQYCTAEEKIQLELREMQQREAELKRHRKRQMARSHPNLLEIGSDEESPSRMNGRSPSPEMNGLQSATSNQNLLDDDDDAGQKSQPAAGGRRRAGLIAQWETRIQMTAATES